MSRKRRKFHEGFFFSFFNRSLYTRVCVYIYRYDVSEKEMYITTLALRFVNPIHFPPRSEYKSRKTQNTSILYTPVCVIYIYI